MLLLAAFRLCPDVGNLLIHPHEQRVAYARKCQLVSTPEIPASGTCAKQGSRQQRNGPEPDFWTIIEKADSPAGGCSGLLLYGAISHQLIVFVPYEFAKDEWLTPRGM